MTRRTRFVAAAALAAGLAGETGLVAFADNSMAALQVPVMVSTEWVAAHANDPDVLLVHVEMAQMRRGPSSFVPGAVLLDYHSIEDSSSLPIELPPVDALVRAFEAIGVSNDTHVVLYGPAPAHLAARAFVTLEYLGHDRVSLMDGGVGAWIAEGRAVVDVPANPQPAHFEPSVNADMLVDAEWIAARLDDPQIAVLDARPAGQFAGATMPTLRDGHIPGAGNIFYGDFLESEEVHRLLPRRQAMEMLAAAGAGPGKTIVSYCQIGMRASYNYVVARHLGYDVKFYDGSWADWGRREDLPAETGPQER